MSFGQSQVGAALTCQGRFYAVVTHTTGNLVKTGPANICRIHTTAGTGGVDVYDGTDTGGTKIYTIASTTAGTPLEVMIAGLSVGLYVLPGSSTTVTVTYD